jgi:hypothetical protein
MLACRRASHRIEVSQSLEEHERTLVWSPLLDGPRQQVAGALKIASLIRRDTLMETFLGFALTFGEGASGAFDVRTRSAVTPFEKGHARPDVDRFFVVAAEVVIETRQQ